MNSTYSKICCWYLVRLLYTRGDPCHCDNFCINDPASDIFLGGLGNGLSIFNIGCVCGGWIAFCTLQTWVDGLMGHWCFNLYTALWNPSMNLDLVTQRCNEILFLESRYLLRSGDIFAGEFYAEGLMPYTRPISQLQC